MHKFTVIHTKPSETLHGRQTQSKRRNQNVEDRQTNIRIQGGESAKGMNRQLHAEKQKTTITFWNNEHNLNDDRMAKRRIQEHTKIDKKGGRQRNRKILKIPSDESD